jgi:hypothetical protein
MSDGSAPAPWPGGRRPGAAASPPSPRVLSVAAGAGDIVARVVGEMAPLAPTLVLLFGTPDGGLPALGTALRERLGPGCRVVGCSSAGEIGPCGYCAATVTVVGFPSASFRAGVCVLRDQALVPASEWMAALRQLHADFRPDLRRSVFGVVLPDAHARQEDVLTATLDAAIPGLPVVGGSSAEGILFAPSCQMVDGAVHDGAALFVLLETDLAVAEVLFSHFSPTDRRAVVTDADPQNCVILELNAEPAAEEYARLAGLACEALTPTEFARHPLLLRNGNRHHVRAIRAITREGGLLMMSRTEPGHVLTLGRAVDMTRGFCEVMDALPRPPLMVLGFDCILRRLALERAGMIPQMSELLARYRVAGFNTYGEQHSGMHVNQTFVGMALMPPGAG